VHNSTFVNSFLFRILFSAVVVAGFTNCTILREPQSLSSDSPSVSLTFGKNVPPVISQRVAGLMKSAIPNLNNGNCSSGKKHISLVFGNAPESQITAAEKTALASEEGFIIKSKVNGNCLEISADGKSSALTNFKSSRGVGYGIYAVLQDMGFKFLHPLRPDIENVKLDFQILGSISRTEEPYWKKRAIHLHTMHPMELTNVLNGWGVSGPNDRAGWEQMLPYWSYYLEWMTAHKQNEAEWMLLWTPEAGAFNQSDDRQARLKKLTDTAKSWGADVGIVTPVRFIQQNGWTLLRTKRDHPEKPQVRQENINEILQNIDWILKCGFTSVGGELGEGEFTKTDPSATLDELNAIANRLGAQNPPVDYRVKIHISQDMDTNVYKDPQTGKNLNFNYIPLFGDTKIGVMPHTVQMYALNDPAPTYDTKDFSDMFRFLKMASSGAGRGKREVLYYPETSYWVSYDVDVPLFLPVYPYRRVEDLRLIAADEISGEMSRSKSRITGQDFFTSGWEWGFWFNDVITAEAAWNPHMEAATTEEAFKKLIKVTLRLDNTTQVLAEQLGTVAKHQHELLIKGLVNGVPPSKIEKRTGMAYLAGIETYDELPMWFREYVPKFVGVSIPLTQPNKFREDWAFKQAFYLSEGKYKKELKPLLTSMADVFQNDASSMRSVAAGLLGKGYTSELRDFTDGTQIVSNRANFIRNLYEARLSRAKNKNYKSEQAYLNLQNILKTTLQITERRKNNIPMNPLHRPLISNWESAGYDNPTDYHYGYTWTSYNRFYWKREFNKLTYDGADGITCYMNTVMPSEIVGQQIIKKIEKLALGIGVAKSCFTIPTSEPDVDAGW
jgi:hypothetical protein